MCGIVGGVWPASADDPSGAMKVALEQLHHRGPDDHGFLTYSASNYTAALGHTRLAIIDLSTGGHQPMSSQDGRFTIVFNGEIYNFIELRQLLLAQGAEFHTESDTEVLLQAWLTWGTSALVRLIGMFAFAVLDRQVGSLTLARDAFGIKPLYVFTSADTVLFGSEPRVIETMHGSAMDVDWQTAYEYLVYGKYDATSRTFYQSVHQVPPAHLLTIDLNSRRTLSAERWWRPSIEESYLLSESEAAAAFRTMLSESMTLHLRSDVATGIALSGGLDSSSLACLARNLNPNAEIHTFSYLARGERIREEQWVRMVNESTRSVANLVEVDSDEELRDLDRLIAAQGEPFGSTSIYAQFLVYERARSCGVTVVLDGQGADEILAGYQGFPGQRLLSLIEGGHLLKAARFAQAWARRRELPWWRPWVALAIQCVPPARRAGFYSVQRRRVLPSWIRSDSFRAWGVRLALPTGIPHERLKRRRVVEALVLSLQSLPALLRQCDRNSMAHSVESRVPFLSIPIVEFLLSLPENYLVSDDGESKSLLRRAMRGLVPDQVLDRQDKVGFETPEGEWVQSMLLRETFDWDRIQGLNAFLDLEKIRSEIETFVKGEAPYSLQIWRWTNFLLWYQQGLREGALRAPQNGATSENNPKR